jgi:hypothetical protein
VQGDIYPGAMIEIRRRPFLTEHIRRIICAERSHVLPGTTGFEPMADLKPAAFAYALVRTGKAFNNGSLPLPHVTDIDERV